MKKRKILKIIAASLLLFFITGQKINAQTIISEAALNKKIYALLSQMTLEEKVRMLHGNSSFTSAGVPRLGIPELVMSDGPHGVRTEHGRGWSELKNVNDSGTYLPVGIALASTWNLSLGFDYGKYWAAKQSTEGKM